MQKKRFSPIIFLVLLCALVFGGYKIWQAQKAALPDYVTFGNGRIEAEETHIATKYAGRVMQVLPQEGDMVQKGDTIAIIDVQDLQAQLNGATANLAAAQNAVAEVEAEIIQREAELELAQAEVKRAAPLAGKGLSQELFDKRKAAAKTAKAVLNVSKARLASTQNQVETAQAEIDRLKVLIDDATLKAPVRGRVQYRLAEPGEVLAAGATVATILDLQNVYMTIFLPTRDIGRLYVGSDARIVLDARPDLVIPAKVSFISSEAQFTPREVETREEREKLMFRVKVRIPKELLTAHIDKVRTGLPGVGYVLLDHDHAWPEMLQVSLPQAQNVTE